MTGISFLFGLTAPSISDQLLAQGYELSDSDAMHLDLDFRQVQRLTVRGVLSAKQRDSALNRIQAFACQKCHRIPVR